MGTVDWNSLLLLKELLAEEVRKLVVESLVRKKQVIAVGQFALQLIRLVVGFQFSYWNDLSANTDKK